MRGSGDDGWRIESSSGFPVLRCAAIESRTPFAHGISTRRGPDPESFDLRLPEDGTGAAGTRRRASLLSAVGLGGATLVEVRQVHGDRVVDASAVAPGFEADAIVVTGDPGIAAGVRVADCAAVLLADRKGRAAAAIHAGWRGVAAGIVGRTIARLTALGVVRENVVAGIGPSIGVCCYRVGRDCATEVEAATPAVPDRRGPVVETTDGPHLDLSGAVRAQLLAAGVLPREVSISPWCTRCSRDLLFSHRGEGTAAGRLLAVIGRASGGARP